MPLRAYQPLKPGRCPYCKNGFDQWQENNERTLEACPTCGNLVEIDSAPRIHTPTVVRKPGTVEAKDAGFSVYKKNDDGLYDKQ